MKELKWSLIFSTVLCSEQSLNTRMPHIFKCWSKKARPGRKKQEWKLIIPSPQKVLPMLQLFYSYALFKNLSCIPYWERYHQLQVCPPASSTLLGTGSFQEHVTSNKTKKGFWKIVLGNYLLHEMNTALLATDQAAKAHAFCAHDTQHAGIQRSFREQKKVQKDRKKARGNKQRNQK